MVPAMSSLHNECHSKMSNELNLPFLLLLPDDSDPHDCMATLDQVCTRPHKHISWKSRYDSGSAFCNSDLTNRVGLSVISDRCYTFGIVHYFGALLWHKPVLNNTFITALLEAPFLPSPIAVLKCSAHTGSSNPFSKGNASADAAAKHPLRDL